MRTSIFLTVLLCGCSSISTIDQGNSNTVLQPTDVTAFEKDTIPQVWSGHKLLDVSEETCARKAADILRALGFDEVVTNGTYVYGNYVSNRAAIKCIPLDGKVFVYAIVAGSDVEIVERLRNEIVWKL
ncbi:MAG: hypothetical protein AAGI72_14460 [Pseudomonadota bacterium]